MRNMHGISHLLAVVVFAGCLAGCGSGNKVETESATVEEGTMDVVPVTDDNQAVITDQGVYPIKTGVNIVDLQPSVENLYDQIKSEDAYDYTVYKFMLDGKERFAGYSFGDGSLSVLSVTSSDIVVETPAGLISLGVPFSRVLELEGVNPEFQALDGNGMWCWIWQGLYFQPSQNKLPQRLSSKLYDAGTTPVLSDFDDDVTVAYIGTGMPF